jgi:mersacidin/lichenicidin family type 2 lantibiotic
MSHRNTLRAWRDYDFWLSLSEGERARMPQNPAGATELVDAEMDFVAGGSDTYVSQTCHHSCLSTYSSSQYCCF